MSEWETHLKSVIDLAKRAGDVILKYYGLSEDRLGLSRKRDHTPVTLADQAAHDLISQGLRALSPRFPILSEEGVITPFEIRKYWTHYWLLDPLDGTRGFIRGLDEFTVNVALIEEGAAIMGVIYAPVSKLSYYAVRHQPAYRQDGSETPVEIHVKPLNWVHLQALLGQYLSSQQLPDILHKIQGSEIIRLNSSLKLCRIAEGLADIYPRLGETSEWDTAAGQCILEAAGGKIVDLNGQPLQYNAKESLINPAFVAMGDPTQQERILQLIQKEDNS